MADIKLIMLTKDNKLSKRCNKRKTEEFETVIIREEDIYELLEEMRKRDQFDEEFDIGNN